MASLHPTAPDPSAETLAQRLARTRDLAGPRRGGHEFGQGGWHSTASFPAPEPPSRFLVLLPFIVLAILAAVVTVGLLVAGGQV